MKLTGQSAIVTGASVGLGYAIARAFLAEGASVAICGRDAAALATACRQLSQLTSSGQRVMAVTCDVADADQVAQLARHALDAFGTVEILVNNAGVLGPIGLTEHASIEEWRATVDTNLFGVLLCCQALLPHFRSRGFGKVINLSGGGAASPRPFFSAYAASKAAVVRFTENLAEELQNTGIDVNAVAPGPLNTRMLDEVLAAGPDRAGTALFDQAVQQKQNGGSPLEKAAGLCVYLASKDSNGITGRLISAPWDPWPTLHAHRAELQTSDIYTLRRIVPSDRDKCWSGN